MKFDLDGYLAFLALQDDKILLMVEDDKDEKVIGVADFINSTNITEEEVQRLNDAPYFLSVALQMGIHIGKKLAKDK